MKQEKKQCNNALIYLILVVEANMHVLIINMYYYVLSPPLQHQICLEF